MPIHLKPELEQKVQRLAEERGDDVDTIVAEAVRQYISAEAPEQAVTMQVAAGNGNAWKNLPPALVLIRKAIEQSRELLTAEDHSKDAGTAGIGEPTWARAAEFLARYAKWVWDNYGKAIDPPDITPGPAGSVDVHWDRQEYELLVNIPADPQAMAGFYGDDRANICIKGKFDPSRVNEGLLQWLIRTS